MAATASAPPHLSSPALGAADHEDSNMSSPLSEVDTKDENDDDIEHMHLDHDDEDSVRRSPRKKAQAASDSDSVLSDAHSDVDDNVTEAETERLYDTPKHQRQRDVVVDQFNEGQVYEHTPSKLRRTANLQDRNNDESAIDDDDDDDDDDASIGSPTIGGDSPTKHATSPDADADDEHKNNAQERKRKRSPAADQSEAEQPLRKRASSEHVADANNPQQAEETLLQEDGPTPANESTGTHTPAEDIDVSPRKRSTNRETDLVERLSRVVKKNTRGFKRKVAAAAAEPDHDTDSGSHDGARDSARGTDVEQHGEEAEADAGEEADSALAHDEELERKAAAFKDWTIIEEMFGVFRDRLYKDRLERLEEEEQSLLASEPTHPEYLNMKQCLDDRLEQKLREINNEHEYRVKAHERRSVAQRAQVWGQYYQAVREKRERTLEALNQEWYDIQTARRSAHSLQDCGLLYPKDPTQRVRNAIAYNTEVSALATIAKYEGFPAGPEMTGATPSELEDDLAAIERAKRSRHKPIGQRRDEYYTQPFDLGPAGEQFLRETPWANPNHLAHKMYPTTGAEATADDIASRGAQQIPGPPPTEFKPSLNPGGLITQKSPSLSARLSESPELTRTMLSPAHQVKRVGGMPSVSRGTKTAAT
ncbi:hypothetical protein F53441_3522 [Fusarium austroafricanum]|uniref:Transcriptional regulatory protein DEP1 n=1 Tax=Fusarium austroafricanum TaxID=2364996 RepID=A0A8H4KPV1_9HYPO|nr:hypothetical protein F53441_3522 [Fusarium austroafricanum]